MELFIWKQSLPTVKCSHFHSEQLKIDLGLSESPSYGKFISKDDIYSDLSSSIYFFWTTKSFHLVIFLKKKCLCIKDLGIRDLCMFSIKNEVSPSKLLWVSIQIFQAQTMEMGNSRIIILSY